MVSVCVLQVGNNWHNLLCQEPGRALPPSSADYLKEKEYTTFKLKVNQFMSQVHDLVVPNIFQDILNITELLPKNKRRCSSDFTSFLALHFPGLPVSLLKQNQLFFWTSLHCKGARGGQALHKNHRSGQNQLYCSALQDYAVGNMFLSSLDAKGSMRSCDISPLIIPLFPSPTRNTKSVKFNFKDINTPQLWWKQGARLQRDTPGSPPRWRAVVQMQLWYTAVTDTARRVTPPLNQALEVALLKKLLVCLYEACRAWTLCRLLKCGAISRNIIDSFFSLQIFKWEAHYGIVFKSWEQVCNSPMCSTGFVPFSVLGQWATYSPKLR